MTDFGEILQAIGDFGPFQKFILFGLCFPNLFLPFHFASLIFNQADTGHHCNTDWILRVEPNLTKEEQLNLTLPRLQDGTLSACEMFIPVDWNISAIREYGLNETTTCTSGWVHYDSIYESTIITDFDLVCQNGNSVELAQTIFMAGILFGSLLFGPFVESFGRQRATQIPVLLMLCFTVATGLSPNFYIYLTTQFIVGVSYGGFRVNCIVLATEWIGITKRSYASCFTQALGGVGQAVLAGIVFFIRNWRIAQFVMAAPIAVVACYIWFIPESARWLLDQGRVEEARKLILKAATVNKRSVPESTLKKLETNGEPVKRGSIKTLFTSSVLRKYFLTLTFGWCALNLAYYCVTLNVGKFGLNIFLTQLIFGLTEVPAHLLCIWLLEVAGRKLSLMCTLIVGSFVCLLILAIPQDSAIVITILATAGRIFMNWAGSICNIYVQELFPTSIRQTATGLGATATRVAGMLSPLVNLLAVYHWTIPTLVHSSLSLTGGALAFMLPETRHTELPDSTQEAEGKRKTTILKEITMGKNEDDFKVSKVSKL